MTTHGILDRIREDEGGQRVKGMWAWTVLRLLLGWAWASPGIVEGF